VRFPLASSLRRVPFRAVVRWDAERHRRDGAALRTGASGTCRGSPVQREGRAAVDAAVPFDAAALDASVPA